MFRGKLPPCDVRAVVAHACRPHGPRTGAATSRRARAEARPLDKQEHHDRRAARLRTRPASLWKVGDESTAVLVSEFYRLRNENPRLAKAEAMQLVQRAMIAGGLRPAA